VKRRLGAPYFESVHYASTYDADLAVKVLKAKNRVTIGLVGRSYNIGRGELVDEEALIDALNTGKIAGAALDAFIQEPLPQGHPFWKTKSLIIRPHAGGMSDIYMNQALSIFEPNLRKFLSGDRQNLTNIIPR